MSEYQYKITVTYCKKIKMDPNRYVNRLYTQIIGKPYLRTIKLCKNRCATNAHKINTVDT